MGEKANAQKFGDPISYRLINWQNIRIFGQTRAASLTIATPFVGYIVLYHEKVKVFLGKLGGFLDESSCMSWIPLEKRLHCLYIGLFLLGLGSILYKFLAPDTVKEFGSPEKYVDGVAPYLTPRNVRMMFRNVQRRNPTLHSPSVDEHHWLDLNLPLPQAMEVMRAEDGHEETKIDVVRSYYNVESRYTNRACAWVVSILFLTGALILAIPGFDSSRRVLCVIFQ